MIITIKPKKSVSIFRSQTPSEETSLGQLTNVDASNPDDGETLVYDATQNKYVVKPVPVTGGTF